MDKYQELFNTIVSNCNTFDNAFDCIVITASNDNQANSFLKQIEYRKKINMFNNDVDFMVVADDDGKRIGSGGSTLSVIKKLKDKYKDFSNKRFLVVHAGGDSKRCPQYSAIGKLFSPIPYSMNDRPATLFDLLLRYVAPLSYRMKEGMLLLSGDVLLLFDAGKCDLTSQDSIAISFKENVSTAKNHGVYLEGNNCYVKKFLHKQDEETLNNIGAVDINSDCNIDTGAIYFSKNILDKLQELVEDEDDYRRLVNDKVRLSLYGDIEYCLASDISLDNYLLQAPEGEYCKELGWAREILFNCLSSYKMKLISLPVAKFVHFGSIKEIMSLMNSGVNKYRVLNWTKNVCSSSRCDIASYNSIVDDRSTISKNTYLENAYIKNSAVGNNCYLSSVELNGFVIPDNLFVHCLKQNNGKYVCRIMSIDDNPKNNVIFGFDIDELIDKYHLCDVFDKDEHSLWNANLYIEADTCKQAIENSLYLYDLLNGRSDSCLFNSSKRVSLCSGFNNADVDSIIEYDNVLCDLVKMYQLDRLIKDNTSIIDAKKIVCLNSLSDCQINWINKKIDSIDSNNLDYFSYCIRLYYYLGYILNDNEYIDKCFKYLSSVIVNTTLNNLLYNDSCKISHENTVVRLPLRVNFGGGWSDTPPHCNEHGGTVINAAINLNGKLPVEVSLTKINEHKIIFESKDMNTKGEFTSLEKLQRIGDPLDPYALQKACLLACGIVPAKGGDLNEILDRLDGGFILCSEVNDVPTGSGLGTSSILSAACVKAMFEFMDIEYDENKLCSTVLAMEQIMSTGGGWQDQIGGITNGIKLITSGKGINQDINIEHLCLSEKIKKNLMIDLLLYILANKD